MSSNKNIMLIMGTPNSGKTSSLALMPDQHEYVYLNVDLKELPFKANFMGEVEVTDPIDILTYIDEIENNKDCKGAVIDTLSKLMEMYEKMYVKTATNTQQAWGEYADFYFHLIRRIKSGSKNYAILAHADLVKNEQTGEYETKVPIKGAVGKIGCEADFTTILSAKQMQTAKLRDKPNSLLHITDDEDEDGVKRVLVTRVTKDTLGEKMRAPIGLWSRDELYVDANLSYVFDRLNSYQS